MKNKKILLVILSVIIMLVGVNVFILPSSSEKLSKYVNDSINDKDNIYFEIKYIESGDEFKQEAYKYQFYKDESYFVYRYIDDGSENKIDEEYYCKDNKGIVIKDKYVTTEDSCTSYLEDENTPKVEVIFDYLLDSKKIDKYFDSSYKGGGVDFTLNELGKKEMKKVIGFEVDEMTNYSVRYFHDKQVIELRGEYYIDDVEYMEFIYYEHAKKLKVPTLKNYEIE